MNKNLKIGIFTYNFPHYKTQQGVFNLFLNGIKVNVAFVAEPVKIGFYTSKIRISPKYTNVTNTVDILNKFNIDCHIVKHNSQDTIDLINEYNLDVGIILGARIIKKDIIKAFNIGILNLHPGLIPINRGLDNVKWAIVDNLKQGVTSHLISHEIDKGSIIEVQEIEVFEDDTLVDIHIRIQELEQSMMIEAIKKIENGTPFVTVIDDGKYNKSLDTKSESSLLTSFDYYKRNYKYMRGLNE